MNYSLLWQSLLFIGPIVSLVIKLLLNHLIMS